MVAGWWWLMADTITAANLKWNGRINCIHVLLLNANVFPEKYLHMLQLHDIDIHPAYINHGRCSRRETVKPKCGLEQMKRWKMSTSRIVSRAACIIRARISMMLYLASENFQRTENAEAIFPVQQRVARIEGIFMKKKRRKYLLKLI